MPRCRPKLTLVTADDARLRDAASELLEVLAHLVRLSRDPDYSEREADDVLNRADALLTRLGVQL